MGFIVLIALLLITYIVWNVSVMKMLNKAAYQNERIRTIHKVLSWGLPFIGSIWVVCYWKLTQPEIDQQDLDANQKKGFYESGKGIYPPGHGGDFHGDEGVDVGGGGTGIGGDA